MMKYPWLPMRVTTIRSACWCMKSERRPICRRTCSITLLWLIPAHKDLTTNQKQVKTLNARIEMIRWDGMLTADQKRERINSLMGTINILGRWRDRATILWIPNDPRFKTPSHTGNDGKPNIHATITVLPISVEKDFRDYILIHPWLDLSALYIYSSKKPDDPIKMILNEAREAHKPGRKVI